MFSSFPRSQHMPCPDCGASVARAENDAHTCDPERRLDYELFRWRDAIAAFEDELATWLGTPQGRFACWLAAYPGGR
jgi:hypothetical protein